MFFAVGQGPKLQKIHILNQKMGLVGSRNFLVSLQTHILSRKVWSGCVTTPIGNTPILEVKASLKGTLRYQKKIYTRHMPHMGACFWK